MAAKSFVGWVVIHDGCIDHDDWSNWFCVVAWSPDQATHTLPWQGQETLPQPGSWDHTGEEHCR